VKPYVEANSFTLLAELVAAGHGIARLPDYMAAQHELVRVLDELAPPPMAWHAVYPSSRHLSPKVRTLVELLERHFSKLSKARR
jgi:DNA-binding transcriptional LysR family regulator